MEIPLNQHYNNQAEINKVTRFSNHHEQSQLIYKIGKKNEKADIVQLIQLIYNKFPILKILLLEKEKN